MLTIRYYVRLILTFIGRFKFLIVVGAFLGISASVAIGVILSQQIDRHIDRIGITGKYTTSELPHSILKLIGNGLTKLDSSDMISPDLATSWESSDDGKTWKFHLDTSRTWADGTKVTSKSFSYNIPDVTTSTPDDSTLIFNLKSAYGPFATLVSQPIFKKGLVGSGAWKVSNLSLNGSFVQKIVIEDKAKNQKIFKFYPSEDATKLAYKLGEIDSIDELIDPKPFDKWDGTLVRSFVNHNRILSVFFNNNDPLLSSKQVRQALDYAIDKSAFGLERAPSPISNLSWAYNSQVKLYDYDTQRAKELISELPKEVQGKLELKLVTYPALLPMAEKISKYWNDIGVKSSVQVTAIQPDDFQAFLAIYDIPTDPDQYPWWHSTQLDSNITGYKSPRIDKLLEDGRSEVDIEKRKKIYLDFQRFIVEDTPAIFLFYPKYFSISRI